MKETEPAPKDPEHSELATYALIAFVRGEDRNEQYQFKPITADKGDK